MQPHGSNLVLTLETNKQTKLTVKVLISKPDWYTHKVDLYRHGRSYNVEILSYRRTTVGWKKYISYKSFTQTVDWPTS